MPVYKTNKDNYVISTSKKKLDVHSIHKFLNTSYWSRGIDIETVKTSIKNSICFGLYEDKKQVGFARVVTDQVLFGYLADVFVIEEFRGKGLSKWLMECIFNHPKIKNLRSVLLATRDAHGLYEKYGFTKLDEPEKYMKRKGHN